VAFATANIIKAEFLENSVDAAEIIVGMTMYEMNMHNFSDLFSINNHKPCYFSAKIRNKIGKPNLCSVILA